MRKNEIDTPALILDLDVAEANIAAMAEYFRGASAETPAALQDSQDA